MVSNNGVVLSRAAVEGHGLVILPDFVTAPLQRDGLLCRVLNNWTPPSLALFAISAPLKGRTRKLKAFTAFVAEQFQR